MSDVMEATCQKTSIISRMKWKIKGFMKSFEKSNYEKHALREFEYAGWLKDGKYDDNMQELMCKQVIQLLRLFGKHGHSGSSHGYAVNLFKTLSAFEPIGAIKCTDDEWEECNIRPRMYQNKRLSSVFKDGKEGKPYYLNAIVWKGEEYDTFTGMVEEIRSRQFIKLPFSPKTFYIDVVRKKIEGGESNNGAPVVQCGDGYYLYSIKDRKQLEAVAEYYDMEALDKSNA